MHILLTWLAAVIQTANSSIPFWLTDNHSNKFLEQHACTVIIVHPLQG